MMRKKNKIFSNDINWSKKKKLKLERIESSLLRIYLLKYNIIVYTHIQCISI